MAFFNDLEYLYPRFSYLFSFNTYDYHVLQEDYETGAFLWWPKKRKTRFWIARTPKSSLNRYTEKLEVLASYEDAWGETIPTFASPSKSNISIFYWSNQEDPVNLLVSIKSRVDPHTCIENSIFSTKDLPS